MAVPNIFANVTTTIPLSQLDANFATPVTLGNTTVALGNTATTLGNLTLTNVTISSTATGIPNSALANSSVTIGNTSVSLGSTATTIGNLTLNNPTFTTPTAGVISATSINFGQTALSYYGEGTWTPSLGGNTTYAVQSGRYTRVGRFVFASFRVDVTTLGTGSASTISGLPFATGDDLSGGSVPYFTGIARSVTELVCSSSSSSVVFSDLTAAATGINFTTSIFQNGAGVRGSVHYQV
jgi:predicted RecA/RadA family phage recombinase